VIIDKITPERWTEAQKYEYETWKPHVEVNPKKQWKNIDPYWEKYYGDFLNKDWSGKTVLEIGTGLSGVMWMMNAHIRIGIEPLADKLKSLNPELWANYVMISHGAESIPEVADASVDAVVTFNVLDHCQDVPAIMEEINRVLKLGGWLAIGCDLKSKEEQLDVGHPIAISYEWFEKWFLDHNYEIDILKKVMSRSVDGSEDKLDGCLIYIGKKQ